MPEQFWSLTPAEFVQQQRGYQWRDERDQQRMAWIVAAIYNQHRKRSQRPLTANDVLGTKSSRPTATTPEAQLELFRRATIALGGVIRNSQ